MNVAGADGSPSGWSVAYMDDSAQITLFSCPSIQDIFHIIPSITVLAIDMIIGLPEQTLAGGREAEKEARKLLSPRGSVVFSAPCRASIYAPNYLQALEMSRASSHEHIGLSKQSYLLAPKIIELDQFLQGNPYHHCAIKETHPELSFWEMNSRTPLPSKHTTEGREKRKELLQKHNCTVSSFQSKDDLDALACLWSALRIQKKEAHSIPAQIPRDRYQIPMHITW